MFIRTNKIATHIRNTQRFGGHFCHYLELTSKPVKDAFLFVDLKIRQKKKSIDRKC